MHGRSAAAWRARGGRVKMRRMRAGLPLVVCIAIVWAAGCGLGPTRLRGRGPTAALTGRVLLAPDAIMPAYADVDLVRQALFGEAPAAESAECMAANEQARTPVRLAAG